MLKIIFFIVLIIILIVSIYSKIPQALYSRFFTSNENKGFSFHLSLKKPDDQSIDPIPQVKRNLEQKSKETINHSINNVKETIYQKAENTLQSIFNKVPENKGDNLKVEIVNKDDVKGVDTPLTVIDVLNDFNLKLTFAKNSKNFLQFKNTPLNFCLYINGNKYLIDDSKFVSINLSISGTYPIKTNFCDLNDKNLGVVIVN